MKDIVAVILAAGKGVRMKSSTPKVLHNLCGRPLLDYSIGLVRQLSIKRIIMVIGYNYEAVKAYLEGKVELVRQRNLSGTADALLTTKDKLGNFRGDILVVCADAPLLNHSTLRKLISRHRKTKADCSILTALANTPFGLGRIIRDDKKRIVKIVEERDASITQRSVREVNSGVYIFSCPRIFNILKNILPDNRKKELYLTDAVSLLSKQRARIESVFAPEDEILGINSIEELARAHEIMQDRILNSLMRKGVTILDRRATYIDDRVKIGRDSIIYPYTFIEGEVRIGRECRIGPFARIRGKTKIANKVEIGNFVEVVRSNVGGLSKIKHHSYIGDCVVKSKANIGAGTIIANFDGKQKSQTVIGEKAFIGSGTVLVAPVKVGKGAVTGAGCVVTAGKDVPPHTIVVGVPARILRKNKGRIRESKNQRVRKSESQG